MFRTAPAAEPAPDVIAEVSLVPLSHLGLDLPTPELGWPAYLSSRDIAIVEDGIGRSAVSSADARVLIAEHRADELRRAEVRARQEREAVEADQRRRAQLWGGIPADHLPIGATPASVMLAAAKDARPKRTSVLQEALAGEGMTYHPLPKSEDES